MPNLYRIIVFVHVAAAVALLSGSVVAAPHVRRAVRRARTAQELRAYLALCRPLAVLEPVAALLLLGSGLYLTSVVHFWSLGWVQVALVFWVVNAVVAGAVVKPAMSRIAAEAATAADGPVSETLHAARRAPRWTVGGDLLMANDAAVLYLMAMKPGLAGSLLTVAAANAAVFSYRLARQRIGGTLATAPAVHGEVS